MKSDAALHALRPSWAKLFFLSIIAIGWAIMIAHPAQLMIHHSPAMGWMPTDFTKALAMWGIMVLAMMVPTLAPMFKPDRVRDLGLPSTVRFILGFILAWVGFCVAVTALQYGLRAAFLLNMHDASVSDWLSAALLIGAGLFQLSSAKRRHLKACRLSLKRLRETPILDDLITKHGFVYGADCVKCCWPMMLTMFVFGLMNIASMAVLTVLMVVEKALTHTDMFSKITGGLFIAAGIIVMAL